MIFDADDVTSCMMLIQRASHEIDRGRERVQDDVVDVVRNERNDYSESVVSSMATTLLLVLD